MNRLTRDRTAKPVSRDQILRRERGQGKNNFPCSADPEQDWQPYPIDPCFCYICDHTYRISLSMEMSRLTRDRTAKPVSRDQILRREPGQGKMMFPCSADHKQDWQPYPVDPYFCYMCDHTYILSTWPLHTNNVCGKERHVLTGIW